ncbi:uncharacterized protein LY89DRAFT_735374 [Mollisia scopiformis]|uniref:Uncharacterized protein n=1 Tax=Mollisia scopiformis TaxID=149040 RepID=A0A194X4Z1_MOLSC|nr:uncharacterized protein LY89DRAFT_735374 [Mollisia scopiformis]KUJ15245.1 hypothetical protein LY89DRAFT_735374 [Mollisia scopiformis]
MDKAKESVYMPVRDDDDELPLRVFRSHITPKFKWFWALLVLEGMHLVLILGGYALYSLVRYQTQDNELSRTYMHGLNTYFDLMKFDTVKDFYGDSSLMSRTAESDALFAHIQKTDGVVAIDTEWALKHNLSPSRLHPEDPTKSIYQIDMFHSMHCVYRLRNMLTSKLSLEAWPRNDDHTLHCLDYIREQLMCSPDLLLQGTVNLIHFNISKGHTCRNSEMITDWAKSHHWEGHRQFLIDTVGIQ